MTEKDADFGDIIEIPNGNRYLVTEVGQLYVGNRNPARVDLGEVLPMRPNGDCRLVGKVAWEPDGA